jgi:PKD repeat protein
MKKLLVIGLLIALCMVVGPVLAAEIHTDKPDYAPEEIVTITGAGFTPGVNVIVTVTRPDGDTETYQPVPQPAIPDGSGGFTVTYQLDGITGLYTVDAADGAGLSAETTFTDAEPFKVNFKALGLPAGTEVTVSYVRHAPGNCNSNTGSVTFIPPAVSNDVNTGQCPDGISFTFPLTIGDYSLTGVDHTSPILGAEGTNVTVTASYNYASTNSPPSIGTDSASVTINEGLTASNTGTWSDANAGDSVTLSASVGTVSKSGNNADGTWSWSFPTTDGPDQSQKVTITANDGNGGVTTTSFDLTVDNVPPTLTISGSNSVDEGSVYTLSLSSSDPGADTITGWSITWDDGAVESISGNPSSATHTYADGPNSYTISATATDEDGTFDANTQVVIVNNVAPTVGSITIPLDPVKIGDPVSVSVSFTDPGTLDTHTAVWNWDDGLTSAGVVTGSNSSGSVSGTHSYSTPGIYTISVTVMDKDGGVGTSSASTYIVIYDPNGGFVTGGGWIISPAGASSAYPDATGKANFGFVSKYKKGATTPEGETEFQFKAGNLNFHSSSYDWLVVAGAKAIYKGEGTINGAGNYGFMLSAIDGTKGLPDKFRIKIWDKDNGDSLVYDNQVSGDKSDNADPTTAIAGGSIVVHK